VREVQLREAKAKLSTIVSDAARGEPSVITRHGKPQAIVIGMEEWRRLSNIPSFAQLLMSAPLGPEDADLFERDRRPMRDVDLES
jgi:antitoxin Phd